MACITDQQQVNAVTLHLSGLYANFEFDLELAMSFSTALTHNDSQAINLPADVLKVEVRAPGQERSSRQWGIRGTSFQGWTRSQR